LTDVVAVAVVVAVGDARTLTKKEEEGEKEERRGRRKNMRIERRKRQRGLSFPQTTGTLFLKGSWPCLVCLLSVCVVVSVSMTLFV
jgi:hypothetical protein